MFHLFRTILRIRLNQLWRLIRSVGWFLILLLIFAVGGVFLALLENLYKADALSWALLIGIILLMVHFSRGDSVFLKKLNIPPRFFFTIEYLSGLTPLLLIMAVLGRWPDLFASVFIVLLVPLLPAGPRSWGATRKVKLSWIPLKAFEWRGGIRQRPVPLLLFYLTGLVLSYFFPFAYIIMLLLLTLTISSFFEVIESKELIEIIYLPHYSLSPKLLLHFTVFHTLILPYHVLFVFRFFAYWYIGLAAAMLSSLLLAFSLLYKYAGYYPRRLKVYNQTPVGVFFLSMLIPFFWPGVIIYGVIKWRQAERRLKYYYADN